MTLSGEAQDEGLDVLQQVVSIVSAFVSHNAMRAAELPEFIGAVHASIRQLAKEPAAAESKPAESPAVPVKRSISREFIVCLECGKKFKSLRRHLSSFHGQTPDEYRAKWSLPSDYPMVAPAYSATRSQLARDSGLGQLGRNAEGAGRTAEADEPVEAIEPVEATGAAAAGETAAEGAGSEDTGSTAAGSGKATAKTRGAVKPVDEPVDAAPEPAEAVETAEPEPTRAEPAEEPKKAKRGRPRKAAA